MRPADPPGAAAGSTDPSHSSRSTVVSARPPPAMRRRSAARRAAAGGAERTGRRTGIDFLRRDETAKLTYTSDSREDATAASVVPPAPSPGTDEKQPPRRSAHATRWGPDTRRT